MALALCLTLLPATAQAAEEDTHTHYLCGKTQHVNIGNHDAENQITFDQWLSYRSGTEYTLVVGGKGSTSQTDGDSQTVTDGKYVLNGGNYYLKTDVKIAHPIQIEGNVTICLNGHEIQKVDDRTGFVGPVFEVTSGTLTLTDCTDKGRIKCDSNSGVYVNGGTLNLYEGRIAENKGQKQGENKDRYGGGVYVEKNGTFNMKNTASVTGNTIGYGSSAGFGGGVYVNGGKLEMNGTSSVTNNIAGNSNGSSGGGVYVDGQKSTFTMNDGAISGNTAKNGGGVCASGGTFAMNGNSKVTNNNGFGVFVNGGIFTVSGTPTVTENKDANDAASNVCLAGGAYITIGKFDSNGNANSIGVTKKKGVDNGVIAKNVSTDCSGKFFSDDKTREVKHENNQLVLKNKETQPPETTEHTHCLCGKTHTAIGDHQTEQEVTFATELKMENGKLMKGGREWIKSMVSRADGGREQRGYVLSQGEYYLYGDITLSDAAILINGDVKLCLNGHTIDRANKTGGIDYVIWVLGNDKAHLTLTDCVGGGTIKGGGNGGVDIFGFCTLDMFGSTITGNTNRGVGVGQFGEFNMYGGKITGNSAGFGGGVYNGGTVNMYGGEISDNTASNKGGGVYMEASVGNYQGGILNVSGAAKITDNTVKGVANNVYLPSGKTIAIGTGSLSGTIGVTTEPKPAAGKPVKVIADTKGNAGLTTHVVSDDNAYETAVQGSTIVLQVVGDGGTTPAGKPAPKYTPPTAKTGLVYNGTAQVLISESHVEGGMMQYRLDNGAYSPDLPTATNAGIYTVYYKVVGDASHNDVAEKSLKVTIAKASLSGTPAYTLITSIGKTLADANLTAGDIKPENGQIKWVDENGVELAVSTEVKANTAYRWKFTPDDTSNYEELTGSITLYPASTGGGGSSGGGGGSSSDRDSSDSNPIIKTETKNNTDGSTTKTETRRDGTVTQTTTGKDGSVSKTETKPNGSSVTENKAADGSTGTVKTDKNGQTEAAAKVSAKAVEDAKKNGEAVKAPVEVKASRNSNTAPTVKVELPKNSGETKVEIPVSNVKPGTVAVLVHPDGTEEILKNSIPTEDGIQLTVDGNATVKIIDNSKGFIDTRNHWAEDAIDFVSARGLVNGMTATIYAPNASTTRAQLWTILARQNDANLNGGSIWYEKAQNWAKDKGVSDGANPNTAINRAQMVTMLWRAVGQPAAGGTANFTDVSADAYYAGAVSWAVENGITTGVGGGRFDPTGACTRAQIAAFLARLYTEK